MALTRAHDTTIDQTYPGSDLDRLWETEFGDAKELVIRCFGISAGGIALWIYNGSIIGPVWAFTYFALLYLNYRLMRVHSDRRDRSIAACYTTFVFNLGAYLTLPIYAMIAGDPLMIFCGAMALIA